MRGRGRGRGPRAGCGGGLGREPRAGCGAGAAGGGPGGGRGRGFGRGAGRGPRAGCALRRCARELSLQHRRVRSARPAAARGPRALGQPGATGAGRSRHPLQRGAAPSWGRRRGPGGRSGWRAAPARPAATAPVRSDAAAQLIGMHAAAPRPPPPRPPRPARREGRGVPPAPGAPAWSAGRGGAPHSRDPDQGHPGGRGGGGASGPSPRPLPRLGTNPNLTRV